jgi:peptide deformylase
VAINPELAVSKPAPKVSGWEGCLSIPGLKGLVPRYPGVHLKACDRLGKMFALDLDGFPAVVAQHETDHLDGVVYVDRMENLKTLCFDREYDRYFAKKETPEAVEQAA